MFGVIAARVLHRWGGSIVRLVFTHHAVTGGAVAVRISECVKTVFDVGAEGLERNRHKHNHNILYIIYWKLMESRASLCCS